MRRPTWKWHARLLAAALAFCPTTSSAASAPTTRGSPLGIVAGVDLGGGGALGGSDASHDLVEVELSLGYDLWAGLRPEAALLLGVAPRTHAAVRLGLHYALPDTPLYARAAIDAATVSGSWDWRWLFFGGGAELRLTDVLGLFAEADVGLPLGSLGYGFLLRAGVTLRL